MIKIEYEETKIGDFTFYRTVIDGEKSDHIVSTVVSKKKTNSIKFYSEDIYIPDIKITIFPNKSFMVKKYDHNDEFILTPFNTSGFSLSISEEGLKHFFKPKKKN